MPKYPIGIFGASNYRLCMLLLHGYGMVNHIIDICEVILQTCRDHLGTQARDQVMDYMIHLVQVIIELNRRAVIKQFFKGWRSRYE